jgi:ribosomal peptide maturation radical SAM protein 1
LLVNMPFANLRWPSLALGLLAAALRRQDIACETAHLNFDFAERVGLDDYLWVADSFAFVLGGERLFAKDYFAGRLPSDDRYFREVLRNVDPDLGDEDRDAFERQFAHVGPFLDHCAESFDWSRYELVGFTASFQQTLASLGLARRIKALQPELPIVFGGAACEGEMGVELLRQFPEIDYVFLGEADSTFPRFVRQLREGRRDELPLGVVGRREPPDPAARACVATPHGANHDAWDTRNLDDLPTPDFDAYFARLASSPLQAEIEPFLFFETSRGCWWGEKHHCAFCGLNGGSLAYRRKSPERAVAELRELVARYGVRRACSADNILDYRYFDTFLPLLAASGLGLEFVYEMKANLTRDQVRRLVDAGLAAAQLGIESLASPILRLAGKGATAIHNLQAVKWFTEAGIEVKWNFLYGFPGEEPADYAWMAEMLPSIVHFAPPVAVGRVRLDRFSPYSENPIGFGLTHVRPHRAFPFVYPLPEESLGRLAYYHEFDFVDGREPLDYARPLLDAISKWQAVAGSAALCCYDRSDGVLLIHDTRPCATAFQWRLSGLERAAYLACDAGRSAASVVEHLAEEGSRWRGCEDRRALRDRVDAMLQRWTEERLMVCVDDRYLSLALKSPNEGQ